MVKTNPSSQHVGGLGFGVEEERDRYQREAHHGAYGGVVNRESSLGIEGSIQSGNKTIGVPDRNEPVMMEVACTTSFALAMIAVASDGLALLFCEIGCSFRNKMEKMNLDHLWPEVPLRSCEG